MDWTDEAFVLAGRKHGEGGLILSLLTRAHGRHAGLVRGGAGQRARGVYEVGNRVSAAWRARLADHLGSYQCELVASNAAPLLGRKGPLAALTAAAALLETVLPEREPQPSQFDSFARLLSALSAGSWAVAYARWERDLLAELGFGLDLAECAATGATEGLAFVSPRTGRAVSEAAAAPWRDKLFRLPRFLADDAVERADRDDVMDALKLTAHFLKVHAMPPGAPDLPPARLRLVDVIARSDTISRSSSDRADT